MNKENSNTSKLYFRMKKVVNMNTFFYKINTIKYTRILITRYAILIDTFLLSYFYINNVILYLYFYFSKFKI